MIFVKLAHTPFVRLGDACSGSMSSFSARMLSSSATSAGSNGFSVRPNPRKDSTVFRTESPHMI